MRTILRTFSTAAFLGLLAAPAFAAAPITIINTDGAGEGLNDPTPAAPGGGNPGITVGQQRLNCFTQAASVWGSILTSPVTIRVQAAFNPLTCTATSAVLGSAGPLSVFRDDPSFEFPGHWYHVALASKEAGADLDGAGNDINAQFNSNLGQATCLAGSGWYYGFDHNEGALIDLLAVLLHEFGHGLGFSTTTSGSTGNYLGFVSVANPGFPAVWDKFLYNETTALHWDEMTSAERVASAINTDNLTWDTEEVSYRGAVVLSHSPELVVPFGSGLLAGNTASFGSPITLGGLTAPAVLVVDALAPTSDGCDPPFTNAAALVGKIAVIDRGVCGFVIKVKNAQNAGAVGCVLVNNVAGPLSPGGSDPTITIPTIALSQADGTALKAAIAGGPTTVNMRLSPNNVAGMAPSGRVRMYAPNPFQGGSSVSHFDVSATPNLLMEPAINPDLTSSIDLTEYLFKDIGWLAHTASVPGSGPSARVALASNPNPARGPANVHFDLVSNESVELTLFDVSGRQVRQLARGAFAAGPHDVAWDGLDAAGRRAAPGVYLARLKGSRTQATHHLVLVD